MTSDFAHIFAARRGFEPLGRGTSAAGGRATASGGRIRRSIASMSRLVRRAFSEPEAAEDPSGDYPPASDCWPMMVVKSELAFHVPNYVGKATDSSPGKCGRFTA